MKEQKTQTPKEKTLAMLKPDGVARDLADECIRRIEQSGLGPLKDLGRPILSVLNKSPSWPTIGNRNFERKEAENVLDSISFISPLERGAP